MDDRDLKKGSLSKQFALKAARGLTTTFKIAGIYMWPPAARWNKPFSWQGAKKKSFRTLKAAAAIGVVVIAQQAIQNGTGFLFPTGQDFMKAQGLSPALAVKLSDQTIRVRQHNFWGKLSAANDMPTIIGELGSLATMSVPGQAYARPDNTMPFSSFVYGNKTNLTEQCLVMLQDPSTTARDTIALLGGIDDPKQIEVVKITDHESWLAAAFHEFRHCDSHNTDHLDTTPAAAEGDADATGILLLAKTLKDPDIARTFLYARALSESPSGHDTALIMDAAMRGVPRPETVAATVGATKDVFALADLYRKNVMGNKTFPNEKVKTAIALRHVMKEYSTLLSPSDMRRAELYIEAVNYFMPHALETAEALDTGHTDLQAQAAPVRPASPIGTATGLALTLR